VLGLPSRSYIESSPLVPLSLLVRGIKLQRRIITHLPHTGFKNGTDGSVTVAVDAMRASEQPHSFMGVTEQGTHVCLFTCGGSELNYARGLAAIVRTSGNKDVHVILRGANSGPNFKSEFVKAAAAAAKKARPDSHPAVMIDCSRASSHIRPPFSYHH